jgi:hypothetical protein
MLKCFCCSLFNAMIIYLHSIVKRKHVKLSFNTFASDIVNKFLFVAVCPLGTYLVNYDCTGKCKCYSGQCDIWTGACPGGKCAPWFMGDTCSEGKPVIVIG